MIRLGLCCIFRDQAIKFSATTATAMPACVAAFSARFLFDARALRVSMTTNVPGPAVMGKVNG